MYFMFDIITIEQDVRLYLPDTILDPNIGILKRSGLNVHAPTMMKSIPV